MKRALLALLALPLAGCWLIGFDSIPPAEQARRRDAHATPSPTAPPAREFQRVEITPDGLFHAAGNRLGSANAESVPIPESGAIRWILVSASPTRAGLDSLQHLVDLAAARKVLVNAIVLPSAESVAAPAGPLAPHEIRTGYVFADGTVTITARTSETPPHVPAPRVRELLANGACAPEESIGLSPSGATSAQILDAAGYFAAAGCRVVMVFGTQPKAP